MIVIPYGSECRVSSLFFSIEEPVGAECTQSTGEGSIISITWKTIEQCVVNVFSPVNAFIVNSEGTAHPAVKGAAFFEVTCEADAFAFGFRYFYHFG